MTVSEIYRAATCRDTGPSREGMPGVATARGPLASIPAHRPVHVVPVVHAISDEPLACAGWFSSMVIVNRERSLPRTQPGGGAPFVVCPFAGGEAAPFSP